MFFNELDLLEIRLNSLSPYVEKFVLCECPVTHSGKKKPLYFELNKKRFKKFNITHLVIDNYERYVGQDPWKLENHQRNFLINGIADVDPETMILVSDLDEIPDLTNYQGEEGVFIQKIYYYKFNLFSRRSNWKGSVALKRKNISSVNDARKQRNRMNKISPGGWHFSTLGPVENVVYKIDSFAHQELNTEIIKNGIEGNIRNLMDPYNRGKLVVEMPSGPQWLLDNKDKYGNLFYEERENGDG